jgi:hypothetical protein
VALISECSFPGLHLWAPQCVIKMQKIVLSKCILCKFQSYCYCSSLHCFSCTQAPAHSSSDAAAERKAVCEVPLAIRAFWKLEFVHSLLFLFDKYLHHWAGCWGTKIIDPCRHINAPNLTEFYIVSWVKPVLVYDPNPLRVLIFLATSWFLRNGKRRGRSMQIYEQTWCGTLT